LKELLEKYGIKTGPVIRMALEEEVKKNLLTEVEEAREPLKCFIPHK
jgi:hypothetical protein